VRGMRPPALLALALLLLPPAAPAAGADDVTWSGGGGTSVLYDRVRARAVSMGALFVTPSWEMDDWDIALDLMLRWTTDGFRFVEGDWDRPGDPFRPLRRAVYHPAGAGWSAGIETLGGGEDLGPGLVVAPSGAAEIGYAVPGFVARAGQGEGALRLEAFADRVVEPTIIGTRGAWRPGERFSLSFEGATDPTAPTAWSGGFDGRRPKADAETRVSGAGGEAALTLYQGEAFGLALAASAALLGDKASAAGGRVALRFDFSPYYRNRLDLSLGVLEGRDGFLPAYFGEAYQVERWGLPGEAPLALALEGKDGVSSSLAQLHLGYRLGAFFEVDGDLRRDLGGGMELARLAVRLTEAKTRGVEAVLWSRILDTGGRLFDPERTYARVSALFNIFPHTQLRLSYHYAWMFREDWHEAVGASEWVGGILYSLTL
jgi:hypothetical protein